MFHEPQQPAGPAHGAPIFGSLAEQMSHRRPKVPLFTPYRYMDNRVDLDQKFTHSVSNMRNGQLGANAAACATNHDDAANAAASSHASLGPLRRRGGWKPSEEQRDLSSLRQAEAAAAVAPAASSALAGLTSSTGGGRATPSSFPNGATLGWVPSGNPLEAIWQVRTPTMGFVCPLFNKILIN
jgi:hypothetical protein